MRESEPLWFADVMAETGCDQCGLCGEWSAKDELLQVQVDEPGHWQRVCAECHAKMFFPA